VVKTEPATEAFSPLLIVRILALVIGMIGLLLAAQRKNRLALAITVIAIAAGLASFLIDSAVLKAEAQSKEVSAISMKSSPSQVELGRQLFIAKGCITCHYNDRAASRSDYWTIEMGAPDLSKYSSAPEILFIRLKDPAAAKSDTNMPNLNLKKEEMEALVAFINSK
jgi:cbb3-type cytochrome oxidase cytochrome c subunit